MKIERVGDPQHRGRETYAVDLSLTVDSDEYDIKGEGVQYTMRPATARLLWARELGQPWERGSSYGGSSKIRGFRVLKNGETGSQDTSVSVYQAFRPNKGDLTEYAKSLPGLSEMIEEIEANLPE